MKASLNMSGTWKRDPLGNSLDAGMGSNMVAAFRRINGSETGPH